MSILDNLNKTISQGFDRAKFEAERVQKTLRLQGEVGDLKRQIDTKRQELGDRAFELYKAGQIQSPTLAALVQSMEALRAQITLKEEELRQSQDENYVEPAPPPASSSAPQASAPPPASPPEAATSAKACPNCQFQMPQTARFCPNCGARTTA